MDFMPLLTNTIAQANSEEGGSNWWIFGWSALVIATVLVFASMARKGLNGRIFTYLPSRLAEQIYLFLENMAVSVVGPHGKKYVPLLLALWSYIFVANIFGLVFPATPTADWSMNIALAVITVAYVQWEGIKANGLGGHIKHFAGPKLVGALVLVNGLLFCVEIISEAMKLFSLSIRLYGNIEGGHIVREALDSIVHVGPYEIPMGGVLLPIKLFTCVIQAFVFCILTCTYLNIVTSHEHDEEHYDVENLHPGADGHLHPEHAQVPNPA